MDIARSETDLVSSTDQTEIVGKLEYGGIRVAGHSWIGVDGECGRNADARNFCQPRRAVDIFYSQVGQREQVVEGLHVHRLKQRSTEGIDRVRANQISITKNKRIGSPRITRVAG